jgi:hypothetical protein
MAKFDIGTSLRAVIFSAPNFSVLSLFASVEFRAWYDLAS